MNVRLLWTTFLVAALGLARGDLETGGDRAAARLEAQHGAGLLQLRGHQYHESPRLKRNLLGGGTSSATNGGGSGPVEGSDRDTETATRPDPEATSGGGGGGGGGNAETGSATSTKDVPAGGGGSGSGTVKDPDKTTEHHPDDVTVTDGGDAGGGTAGTGGGPGSSSRNNDTAADGGPDERPSNTSEPTHPSDGGTTGSSSGTTEGGSPGGSNSNVTVGGGPVPVPTNSSVPTPSNSTTPPTTSTTTTTTEDGGAVALGSASGIGDYTVVNGTVDFPANSTAARWVEKALAALKAQKEEGFASEGGGGTEGDSGAGGDMPGIIDGERSDPGEFSYMVLAKGAVCGGTLVAKDVVMTAAHCRGYFSGKVLVGAYRRNSTQGGAQWRKVLSTMQVHPDYDPEFSYSDVMLFKIAPSTLEPVELNIEPDDDPLPGANLTVAGFGLKTNNPRVQVYPQFLQKATVQSLDDEVCNTLLLYAAKRDGFPASFQPEIMTCTIGIYNDAVPIGPCHGDSGGPLLDALGKQVGIVSWGGPDLCGTPIVPEVYTRVSGVIDFIHETICKLTVDPSALPFTCPDFVCPPDVTVLGFDNLKVPSADGKTRSFNGFTPVAVTQVPRAGSTLGFGEDTFVKVKATDASGASISCKWKVTVPFPDIIGSVAVELPKGQSGSRNALIMGNDAPGLVWAFAGFVDDGVLGPKGTATARLRVGQNTTTPPITLTARKPYAGVDLEKFIPITDLSNPRVLVNAKGVRGVSTILIYFIYGQLTDYVGFF